MKPFPYHTQSVERLVKEVSFASAQVFSPERRDGFVHARKLVPKVEKNRISRDCSLSLVE
jgi:hypothetical protein